MEGKGWLKPRYPTGAATVRAIFFARTPPGISLDGTPLTLLSWLYLAPRTSIKSRGTFSGCLPFHVTFPKEQAQLWVGQQLSNIPIRFFFQHQLVPSR